MTDSVETQEKAAAAATAKIASESPPSKIPGDLTANRNLPDAVDDAEMLVCFAAERGLDLKDELTKSVVAARRQLERGGDLSEDDEARFWNTFNALTKVVAPVTTSSLRATLDSHAPDGKKFFGFEIRRGSLARRAVNGYTNVAIASLIVLLLVQVYWLFGSEVTSDIQKINKEIAESEIKLRALQRSAAGSATPPAVDAKAKSDAAAVHIDDVDAKVLAVQIENLRMRKNASYNLLKLWIWPLEGWVSAPAGADTGKQIANENIARLQLAQVMLEVIQRYMLPLLYGLLGTCVYILRTLAGEIRLRVYSEASNIGFLIRLYLGTLGGMVIAWFLIPDTSDGLFKSLSPFALAFLAGYSVELVFAAMDRLLAAFTSKPTEGAKPGAGAPNAAG